MTRQVRDELAEELGSDKWDRACNIVVIPEILYEIARRHYKE